MMPTTTRALRLLLLAHAVVTGAAGIVLVVAPGLVPGAVGIALPPSAYLLAYLLAGAEFGFAALSFLARRLTDVAALRAVVLACVVFHAASAALEAIVLARDANLILVANIVARLIVIALFLAWRPRSAGSALESGRR